jgi:glycosyltransferase involved in cell wall biosynthesis
VRARAFLRALGAADADVYYQRGRSPLTGMTARFCSGRGRKFVWAMSGEPSAQRGKYSREVLPGKRGIRRHLLRPWFALQDAVTEYGVNGADIVLAQSRTQRERLRKNFGRESVIFPSGHPVPGPGVLEKPSPVTVAWVGSVKEIKQPGLFLELARRLEGEGAQFVMAGRMSDAKYRAAVTEAERELASFRYLGELPFGDIAGLFGRAGIVVNTTVEETEGLPNVFIQAWLHGAPVVSLHDDPDKVMAEEGIGYRAGSLDVMEEKVRGLVRDPALRKRMGEKARTFAAGKYGIETVVDRFAAVVEGGRGTNGTVR